MHFPSIDEKFNIVLSKNTFYFYNSSYEEYYEGHISSIAQNIFLLKNKIETKGLKESILSEHITEVEDGLDAILTITGFSKESLQNAIKYLNLTEKAKLKNALERYKKIVRIQIKKQPEIMTKIGKKSMNIDKIFENMKAVVDYIAEQFPHKYNNIRSIYIKTTMGRPIKIDPDYLKELGE
jgi:hypothetical protein